MAISERGITKNGNFESRIAEGIVINGSLVGEGDLQLSGSIKGEIELKSGTLTITQEGYVEGDVTVKCARIAGELRGTLTAGEQVVVANTGRIEGKVKTPRIAIHDGASCKGDFIVET